MKFNIEPIRSWFGYSRRERRASLILVMIIIFVLCLRVAIPAKNIIIRDITDTISFYDLEKETVRTTLMNNPSEPEANSYLKVVRRNDYEYRQRKLINLNNCDTSQLISLPGIGPVLSVRIIKYRNLLGGFATVEQLKEVYGLSPETFELIKERVIVDTTLISRININTAAYKELSRLPYFEKYEVTAILKYRELKGRIEGINELPANKLIPVEKVPMVRPYLNF